MEANRPGSPTMMIVRTTARDARVHLKPADVLSTLNTLGAPEWTLEDVARNARAWGYAGVDLRLLDGELIGLPSGNNTPGGDAVFNLGIG